MKLPRRWVPALFIILGLPLLSCAVFKPAPRASTQVGLPLVLRATDLEGNAVDLSHERGKVVVVDFWATWCTPCRQEIPFLEERWRESKGSGLVIYGVSFDADKNAIAPFRQKVPFTFPVLWDRAGEKLAGPFQAERLPTLFLIDRQGLIRFVHQGFNASEARSIRGQIKELLAERASR